MCFLNTCIRANGFMCIEKIHEHFNIHMIKVCGASVTFISNLALVVNRLENNPLMALSRDDLSHENCDL